MSRLDYGIISEQMTDAEIDAFRRAGEFYLNHNFTAARCIIALEINRKLWDPVWKFMGTIDFFNREDGTDAE